MSDGGDEAAAWLAQRLPQLEADLRELVEVNSFTDNREGGQQVGALLRAQYELSGLSAEVVASARFADHRVFRSEGDGSAPVAVVGHLDTVFPPGRFEGYREDGTLRRGPGVLDMKGGLVVIGWAVRALAQTVGLHALPPLRIVVVSDEEVGSPEGANVIRGAVTGAKSALVFESGRENDAIVTRRKGSGALAVTAHGKAAHAGNAHAQGVNALWALARYIDSAQRLTDYDRGRTVNVGKVTGGQGKNTVPDEAVALLDFRFTSLEDGEALVKALGEAASSAASSVPGSRLTVEGGVSRQPLEKTPGSEALLALYGRCAHASGLGFGEAPLQGGGSDASTTGALGIPSIDGLGPRGAGFHTVDEHIHVDSLVPKAQAFARCLWALRKR